MNSFDSLKTKLKHLRYSLLRLQLSRGLWIFLGGISTALFVAGLLEMAFRFTPAFRIPLFLLIIATSLFLLTVWVIYPFLRNIIKPVPHKDLALLWGYSLADINDRLLNALQVYENRNREKTSPELAERALSVISDELQDTSIECALDRTGAKKVRNRTIRMAGVWLIAAVFVWGDFTGALGRVFNPGIDFRPPPPFALFLEGMPDFVVKEEPLFITVAGAGDLPAAVTVAVNETGSDPVIILTEFDSSGFAHTEFSTPQSNLEVFAFSGNIFSDTTNIEVKARPFIKELQVRWFPPAYSKLPSGSSIGKRGDVASLKGSLVRLSLQADRAIKSADLIIFSDSNPYQPQKRVMEVIGEEATVEFNLLQSGHYNIIFADNDGIQNAEPVDYNLWPIQDEWPTVKIFYPPADAELNESLLVPLKAGARDDFAISKVRLGTVVQVGDAAETPSEDKFNWQDIPFESFEDGTVLADRLVDFNDLNLLPGDIIFYKLQVWDNDRISGPKKAETPVQRLIFPTLEEIFARMEHSFSDQVEDISETLERSRLLKEGMDALREELKRNPDLSWEEKKNVEAMLAKQQEMSKQTEQMAQQIEEMLQKMDENRLLSPETMEKYSELQQMLSEVMTPELMEAMQKLQDALKQQDPEQLRRAVEEFSFNQEEFLNKMEKTLNILKQLQMEMKLDELAKRAEKLWEQQQDINQALKDSSNQQNSEEQVQAEKELQSDMEAFEREFAETKEMLEESPFNPQEEMAAADQLLDESQFPQEMESMSQDLQQGDTSLAQKKGSKIETGLEQLAEMMKQAKEQMISTSKSELADALKRISHDLLYLSYQQEDLMDKSSDLDRASPQFRTQAQEQQTLKGHLEKTADDLYELSQKSFFITPQIGMAIAQAYKGMDQALSGYTARTPRSVARPQQSSMGGMNIAVMLIGESLDQMNSSSSSTGFSEMMEQLSKMSGMQSQINQGTMTLLPGGNNPGQMSMEQQAAMSRLAAEQEALRREMENWSQSNQELSKMMGRLGQLSEEMKEVVDDLKNRQVDERTIKRQERILRRLLDAQKSVREREYRKERLSRTAEGLYQTSSPDEIQLTVTPDEVREKLLQALREGYTRDYQQLIKDYFDALAREN